MDKCRLLPLLPYGRVDNVLFRAGVGFASGSPGLEELKTELGRIKAEGMNAVVFPSHFLELDRKLELLFVTRELGLNAWIQISPGAELSEFFPWVLENAPLALEIVIDRSLYSSDLEKLDQLKKHGGKIRFVFCPTREMDSVDALSRLPREILQETTFYFGVKKTGSDSFLGADEIFTLLQDLKRKLPELEPKAASYLRGHEPRSENGAQSDFRFSLDAEYYQRNFDQMGDFPRIRRIIGRLDAFSPLRLPLLLSFYGLWLIRDPLEMLADLRKRGTGFVIRAFWACIRIRDVFHRESIRAYWIAFRAQASSRGGFSRAMAWMAGWTYWPLYRLVLECFGYSRRYGIISYWTLFRLRSGVHYLMRSFYWGLFRLWSQACHLASSCYWRVYPYAYRFAAFMYWTGRSILSSPAWFLRERLPFVYWVAVFPFQKTYWFVEFQMRKRVLK